MSSPEGMLRDEVALEFFSGIGGLHYALKVARPQARVARAFDVDDVATRVYSANFGPAASVSATDVCHLDAVSLNALGAGLWLLSPPCQPYTRQGLVLGAKDKRASGISHLTQLLASPELEPPSRFLMENVAGFEGSESRDVLVGALRSRGFSLREFWLSPVHLGIPNQRTRYFLLGKRGEASAAGWAENELLAAHELPPWEGGSGRPLPVLPRGAVRVERSLREYLEKEEEAEEEEGAEAEARPNVGGAADATAAVGPASAGGVDDAARPDGGGERAPAARGAISAKFVAKYAIVLDVVGLNSTHSSCFTKNYARFAKGTGSVLATFAAREEQLETADQAERAGWALRYFSPREIANLHGFPRGDGFRLPADMALRKQYNLLGNSLSVDVVAELVRHLYAR
ncbi:S-adenosyl-L-methionine-dependent methyltransferase [Pavlovales sp. CCMP2436]|nr:S-adenosyl-L-methionine-dependent methyltransferase [Pavlovales sp. CCMP2436]